MFTIRVATVTRNLKGLEFKTQFEAASALYQEALDQTAESMRRTPVDTSTLQKTHKTSLPVWKGDFVEVAITAGGATAPYAVPVHERTEVLHNPGQAKFLESTVLESAPFLLKRIAARLKKGLF